MVPSKDWAELCDLRAGKCRTAPRFVYLARLIAAAATASFTSVEAAIVARGDYG